MFWSDCSSVQNSAFCVANKHFLDRKLRKMHAITCDPFKRKRLFHYLCKTEEKVEMIPIHVILS